MYTYYIIAYTLYMYVYDIRSYVSMRSRDYC